MRVLILGGTSEASGLARLLAGDARFSAVLSLAGVTRDPAPSPIARRVGGFGGAAGLAWYLRDERVAALVDATHPFATRITANARAAADGTGVGLLRLCRPAWRVRTGWDLVADAGEAMRALGDEPARVLLTVGRGDLAPFRAADRTHVFWVRSIDPPDRGALPDGAAVVLGRPPFLLADEVALMRRHRITHLVTKNSGGDAVAAKLEAASVLGVRVVMIARPAEPQASARAADAHGALAWLVARLGA